MELGERDEEQLSMRFSLLLFEFLNAFCDRKVLLLTVLAYDEEASSFLIGRVRADFEVREVGHLFRGSLMEVNDLFYERLIVAFKAVTVALEIKDGTALRLDLVMSK